MLSPLMAIAWNIWANAGEMPVTPTKWTSYAELVPVLLDRNIYDVTQATAGLGKMEIEQENKGVQHVQFAGAKTGKGGKEKLGANKKQTLTGPIKVSCHTTCTALIAAGVNPTDGRGQSTAMLFALWKDFSTEQKYTKRQEGQTNEKIKTQVLILQELLNKDR
jgi:hypothetical protein